MQGRLFNPDNPPEAFSKEEVNQELEKIKEELRNQPGWYRQTHVSKSRIMDQFHDRRDDGSE